MNKDIKVILDALRKPVNEMSKHLLLDELEELIRDNTELNLKFVKQPKVELPTHDKHYGEMPEMKAMGDAFDKFSQDIDDMFKV